MVRISVIPIVLAVFMIVVFSSFSEAIAEEDVLRPLDQIHNLLETPSPVVETTDLSAPEDVPTVEEREAIRKRVETILTGEKVRSPGAVTGKDPQER